MGVSISSRHEHRSDPSDPLDPPEPDRRLLFGTYHLSSARIGTIAIRNKLPQISRRDGLVMLSFTHMCLRAKELSSLCSVIQISMAPEGLLF